MRKRAGIWIAWWAFLVVVWMLLVDTFARAEVLAGVVVAAVGAVGAEAVRRARLATVRLSGLFPAKAWRLPWVVLTDCWLLSVALWRQLRHPEESLGTFRGIAFDAGGDDAAGASRRALYTTTISLTPNTYVIGIDREEGNMLIHELVAGPRATTARRVLGRR